MIPGKEHFGQGVGRLTFEVLDMFPRRSFFWIWVFGSTVLFLFSRYTIGFFTILSDTSNFTVIPSFPSSLLLLLALAIPLFGIG